MISTQTEKLTLSEVERWIHYAKNKSIVAGYGSLMSENSRFRFNGIDCRGIGANVHQWERHWITRSQDEKQTYVGAVRAGTTQELSNQNQATYHPNSFNVQLVPVEMDEALIKREQDYKFTQLQPTELSITENAESDAKQLLLSFLADTPVLICETLAVEESSADFPISLSYIATCLKGCFDYSGIQQMKTFMEQTKGWNTCYVRVDTNEFIYPRAAQMTPEFLASCMSLLVQHVPEEQLLRESR